MSSFVSKVDVRGDIYNIKDYELHSKLGQKNGIATLGEDGTVPKYQLPSYVDDVLDGTYDKINNQFLDLDGQPYKPESNKIYIDINTKVTYRWSGSTYVELSTSLALGTTAETAFPGDRGLALENKLTQLELGSMVYKGEVNNELPLNYSQGDVYLVATAGTYAGQECEEGDFLICVNGNSINLATLPEYNTNVYNKYMIIQSYNPTTQTYGVIDFVGLANYYGSYDRIYYDYQVADAAYKRIFGMGAFVRYQTTDHGLNWSLFSSNDVGFAMDTSDTVEYYFLYSNINIYNNENGVIFAAHPYSLDAYNSDWKVVRGGKFTGSGGTAEVGDGYTYVDLDSETLPAEEIIKTLQTLDGDTEKKVYPVTTLNAVVDPETDKTLDVILDEFTIDGVLFVDDEPPFDNVEIKYAVDGKKVYYDNTKTELPVNNVQDALDAVFTSVSSGKELIASAITDKGIETDKDASFETMAENISNIKAGGGTSELNIYFGLNEPEDKTKLWVKDEEPISCLVSNRFDPPEGGFKEDEMIQYDTSEYYDDKAAYCNGKIYILKAGMISTSGTGIQTNIPIYIFNIETQEISMIYCQNPSNFSIWSHSGYDRGFTIGTTVYFSLSSSQYHIEIDTINDSAIIVSDCIGGGLVENSSLVIEDDDMYYCYFYNASTASKRTTTLKHSPVFTAAVTDLYVFPDKYVTSFDLYYLNGIIYVFYGISVNTGKVKRTKLLIYDLDTKTTRTIDCSLSKFTASDVISISNIGHYIYLFQYNSNTVYKYNTIIEELTYQEIPYTILNRQKMPIISVGSNLYLIDTNRILKFQGNIDVEELPLGQYLISPSFSDNIFPFSKGIINVDMGVEGMYKNIQDYDMISTVPIEAYLYNSDIGWYSIYND